MVVGEKRGGAEEANTKKARVLRDQSLIWGGGGGFRGGLHCFEGVKGGGGGQSSLPPPPPPLLPSPFPPLMITNDHIFFFPRPLS